MRVSIDYFSHYRKEFIRATFVDLKISPDSSYDVRKIAKAVHRRLRSKDSAQNNFYVKVMPSSLPAIVLDLSTGKLVEEFEVKEVLRFPRKRK